VSPILVRPVREQLEHDRIIRLLQAKFRRRFEIAINPGMEQNASVGPLALHPDLVLFAPGRGHRLQGVIEVETGESVNHLEALAEWAHFSRLRAPFHLYIPSGMVEVARRLCSDNGIHVNEIWSYHVVGEEVRFTLVHRARELAHPPRARARTPAGIRRQASRSAGKRASAKTKTAVRRTRPKAVKSTARAQKRK
jgi:hypothetical protein